MNIKKRHIEEALNMYTDKSIFEEIKVYPYSIPIYELDEISLTTSIQDVKIPYPIYINAMTGGEEISVEINKKLKKIAKSLNIPLFFGSFSKGLQKEYLESYDTKDLDLFGMNIGIDKDFEIVEKIYNQYKPTFMQVHVNAMQEYMQGKEIKNWYSNLEKLKKLPFKIILKETGFGMTKEMIELGYKNGITCFDISGRGGANFSLIEKNIRNVLFKDHLLNWGLKTTDSLIDVQKFKKINKVDILASGGVKTPYDILVCLILGAKAVGISSHILYLLTKYDTDKVIDILKEYMKDLKFLMSLLGTKSILDLKKVRWSR